jgi:hypothetical protein
MLLLVVAQQKNLVLKGSVSSCLHIGGALLHGAGTFLELLEPYILKDMLGALPPEVMQALVEHYSQRGWLERVEQCVLHMDIASLDFNQVVKLCREHGLYNALIYLFTKGLDDFTSPMEELLAVAQHTHNPSHPQAIGFGLCSFRFHGFFRLITVDVPACTSL